MQVRSKILQTEAEHVEGWGPVGVGFPGVDCVELLNTPQTFFFFGGGGGGGGGVGGGGRGGTNHIQGTAGAHGNTWLWLP